MLGLGAGITSIMSKEGPYKGRNTDVWVCVSTLFRMYPCLAMTDCKKGGQTGTGRYPFCHFVSHSTDPPLFVNTGGNDQYGFQASFH